MILRHLSESDIFFYFLCLTFLYFASFCTLLHLYLIKMPNNLYKLKSNHQIVNITILSYSLLNLSTSLLILPSTYLPFYLLIILPINDSIYLLFYLFTVLLIHYSTYLSFYLSTILPIYHFTYSPFYLSTILLIHHSTYLLFYLSTILPVYHLNLLE